MSTFDIKKFLINEGLTRVSRDRNRFLKEEQEKVPEGVVYRDFTIHRDGTVTIGQVLEKDMPSEEYWTEWFKNKENREATMGGRSDIQYEEPYLVARAGTFSDSAEERVAGDLGYSADGGVEYNSRDLYYKDNELYGLYPERDGMPETEDEDDYMDGDDDYPWDELEAELDEEVNHEVATRYRNITMADPKNADSTKSARNTQHGSTSHHYTGLGSVNQDAEHRKEQQKQNAKLKKQMGIKTKHMSKEDWITKKLNKELGL